MSLASELRVQWGFTEKPSEMRLLSLCAETLVSCCWRPSNTTSRLLPRKQSVLVYMVGTRDRIFGEEYLSIFEFLVRVVGPRCPVMRSWLRNCSDLDKT